MNKLYSLLLFFLCLFLLSTVRALNLPLLGKVIYLDPGHGGYWKIQKSRNGYKY